MYAPIFFTSPDSNRPHSLADGGEYNAHDAPYYAAARHQDQQMGYGQFVENEAPTGSGSEQMASSHDFVNWERIGRGGFGKVYRAQPRDSQLYPLSPDSHGYVAIKVVDKRALKDSAAEMRLATEVAIHESLAHSSVVHIYDSFEDDRCVYLVMEYCERGDLWRYLRQRHIQASGDSPTHRAQGQAAGSGELAALSEPETRYVVQQVAAAVAYLHANGVLHRDLKLANIMLSRSMGIKIGDFGLATKIDDGSMEPTTMCGTPSYISPEIMARQPYGFESDVWAIGCLLVTLLTGAQPFRGVKHITDDVVSRISLPHSTSPEARSLVRALLRIDPRQRIRSQDLLAHSYNALQDGARILPPRHPDIQAADDALRNEHQGYQRGDGANRRLLHRGEDNRNALHYADNPDPHRFRPEGSQHSRAGADPQSTYYRRPPSTAALDCANRVASRNEASNNRHYSQAAAADEAELNRQPAKPGQSPTPAAAAVSLDAFTTRRLQPLKRAMKNGKIYLRADHLLVLDLATVPTIVAMNERLKEIYECKRPLHIDALSPESAYRIYPWDLAALPERVSRTVRTACRCVSFLLSQQKRVKISTPQGRGWLFEDAPLAAFKFSYFNGIKVEIARKRLEAIVEIPSKQDLPNEIQKIPLAADEFPAESAARRGRRADDELALDISDLSLNQHQGDPGGRQRPDALDSRVPGKVKGILAHAKEALRRALDFDAVLREFEEGGAMARLYEGEISYPVELAWDWDMTVDLDYVPPGLARRKLHQRQDDNPAERLRHAGPQQSAMPMSASNTVGSTTVISSLANNGARHADLLARAPGAPANGYADSSLVRGRKPDSAQWGAHMLDRRTVDDTPTRRLNLGPITRLVEEFNKAPRPLPPANAGKPKSFLHTPGSVLRTPASRHSDAAFAMAQQAFQGASFIPEVGWCMAAEGRDADDYAITILYCDGCRVLVKVKDQVATYKDDAAEYTDLPFDHSMPPRVKERLTWLPQFLAMMGLGV
ncbi:hypothetical protein GGI25_001640 [Coemansia spiralis]|uniref:Protein kinase domain-containing protein n=1 Tax=Coemansia spiralis TaxID=417178 RepID=A0A9W8GAA5_9FUNG|nr:hypothetical protein GGI25_001640 [Coemansia spiralis]